MKSAYLGAAYAPADPPPNRDLPEIAVIGRSNVGKSSLINMLLARHDMARVSKTPGRTQALHFYSAEVPKSPPVCLVDLPGYGYAAVPDAIKKAWPRLVYGYLDGRQELRVGLLLVDIRRDPREEEKALLARLQARSIPVLIGITKADQVAPTKRASVAQKIADQLHVSQKQTVLVSTLENLGRDTLWTRLVAAATAATA